MKPGNLYRSLKSIVISTIHQMDQRSTLIAFFSSGLMAFGLYNIHAQSGVTEGGILGLTLFLEHWLHISPSVSGFILNMISYILGWKLLGRLFLAYSVVAAGGFSLFYGIFEQFPPVYPQIAQMPLTASLVGALFVGIGAGLCVRIGGAPGGDDALSMSMCKLTGMKIQWAYMISDLAVLALSLTYIPLHRILYSLLTVTLSGQIIGIVQNIKRPGLCSHREAEADN